MMTEDQIRQAVREMYRQAHGIYPTDAQAQEFVYKELKPIIEQLQQAKNEHTRNTD